MRIYVVLLFLLGSLVGSAQTTYYVAATGGDNRNQGTKASPWASLDYAVTAAASGDIIYLLEGTHNISTQVNIPVGISITGAGEASIISSTVTAQWKSTILLHSATEGTNGNQSISYIKMDGNGTAWGAIQVNARSNVHIYHCTFVDFFSCGVIFNASTAYGGPPSVFATGNKFYNNVSNNCSDYPLADDGQGHIMFGGQDGIEIFNNRMTQTSRELKRNGYLIKFYSYGYSKAFKIYNNILNRAIGSQSYPYYDFCIETWHTLGGAEIFNNTMTGGIDVGGGITYNCLIRGDYDYGIWIHNNIIGPETYAGTETTGIYLECNTDGAIIERNYFRNHYNGIMVTPGSGQTCKNHIIRYNVFDGVRYYGLRFINGAKGGFAENISLYNNVFNAGSTSLIGIGLFSVGTTTDLNVSNNIIVGFDYAPMFANGAAGQTIDNLTIKNNILYQNANSNNPLFSNLTPTNYTNSGNIIGNPSFYSATNFHFNDDSPGIGAGIKMADDLKDLDGVNVGDPPNIGCFESLADLASPTFLSAVVENANPKVIIISFDMPLLQIVPDRSAFDVVVNSQTWTISSVSILDGKVIIDIDAPVSAGDLITFSYSVPAVNPLQSVTNINVSPVSGGLVTNNVKTEFDNTGLPDDGSEDNATQTLYLFNIYPNPVYDSFTFSFEENVPNFNTVLRITNLNGTLIQEESLTVEMLSGKFYIDLKPGVYCAHLITASLILGSCKFVVAY